MSISKFNPRLTLEFLQALKSEDQYFDRKTAKIEAPKLADCIIGFANADGGTIVVGIRDRKIEGINNVGADKINSLIQASIDFCHPMVRINHEFVDVIKENGEKDQLLLIHVEQSERVHKNRRDEVFLRVGDETRKLSHEERLQLEYDKGEREFEIVEISECTIDDLDNEVLQNWASNVGFSGNIEKLLLARGLATNDNGGKLMLRVAAILLFAKEPTRFLPNARVRFIRFDGASIESGIRMNITKLETIEGPIPKIIEKTKIIVSNHLRDFMALGPHGRFITVPEYPEFAWQEGLINALTHRAYNIQGSDIQIRMFDDKLEIESPGKLPGLVRLTNIKDVRYSRNPRIARVLNEFGWVREFGEGVNRIFEEMKLFNLDDPIYEEPYNVYVKLTLKNNIVMRRIRREAKMSSLVSPESWEALTPEQRKALELAYIRQKLTTKEFAECIGRSRNTAKKILESLCDKQLLKRVGTSNRDPNLYYELIM
ncbi:ATP-binding protein [Desulfoscipio geothermicus]|uniref:ATP-dependent DNA helicase RecG n=1 Tax=Desulfoscipio geothermicus DSM 3669 TaxID=1121426 RepID=A0A1I6CZ83_9FIRM|nr:ATP-binding protein [Desulfoscipio geothermicus]SFQ98538.1 ATP-dependent DNA helicase RecG [Desulfoscipio geothermicus DSM 3669]